MYVQCMRVAGNHEGVTAVDDLYAMLRTSPQADAQSIQAAYRRLAFQLHPDRNPERPQWAEEQMKRLNAAYYILSHPVRRQSYDYNQFGRYAPPPTPLHPTPPRNHSASSSDIETDWRNLHVCVGGNTLPDEDAIEQQMAEYLREFVRLVVPLGSGKNPLAELLLSAATSQFTVYSAYARLVAKIMLRTTLAALRSRTASDGITATTLRQIVREVNSAIQTRMGAERLRIVEHNKNIVADWSGMLLTLVDFLWGEAAA